MCRTIKKCNTTKVKVVLLPTRLKLKLTLIEDGFTMQTMRRFPANFGCPKNAMVGNKWA